MSRRLACVIACVATLAAPVGVMAATPPGTAGGSGEIEVSLLSQVVGALAPILGIAVVLAVLIGFGALVARIGGRPGAQKAGPSALAQVVVAIVAVGAVVCGVFLGREIVHERSVGGLGGAIGAGLVTAFLVAIVVLLVGTALVATKLRHGDISRTIRTMFIAAGLLVAGAIGGGATAGLSGGLYEAPVVLSAAGETTTEADAELTAFVGRARGEATCTSAPNTTRVESITALDLGELRATTLRGTMTFDPDGAGGAIASFWIDGADLPEGDLGPSFDATVETVELAADGRSGTAHIHTSTGPGAVGKGGEEPPAEAAPLQGWPSSFGFSVQWTCASW